MFTQPPSQLKHPLFHVANVCLGFFLDMHQNMTYQIATKTASPIQNKNQFAPYIPAKKNQADAIQKKIGTSGTPPFKIAGIHRPSHAGCHFIKASGGPSATFGKHMQKKEKPSFFFRANKKAQLFVSQNIPYKDLGMENLHVCAMRMMFLTGQLLFHMWNLLVTKMRGSI